MKEKKISKEERKPLRTVEYWKLMISY